MSYLFLAVSGSLRAGSVNGEVLKAINELSSDDITRTLSSCAVQSTRTAFPALQNALDWVVGTGEFTRKRASLIRSARNY